MNSKPSKAEREHLAWIKEQPCVVCGAPPISEAHHIKQSGAHYCIPLCKSCHTGKNGIHGERLMWKLKKLDEMDCLAMVVQMMGKR
jgi:hypothetical protein